MRNFLRALLPLILLLVNLMFLFVGVQFTGDSSKFVHFAVLAFFGAQSWVLFGLVVRRLRGFY